MSTLFVAVVGGFVDIVASAGFFTDRAEMDHHAEH